MPYTIQTNKTSTFNASGLAAGATSGTLSDSAFGSPSGIQLYVVDYDVPAKLEVISAAVANTAVTSITRGLDGTSDVAHSASAKIMSAWVPSHYALGLGHIARGDAWTSWTPTWTNLTVTGSTVSAKYRQFGTLVMVRVTVTLGGGNAPSGSVSFTLPVTAVDYRLDSIAACGLAEIQDSGTQSYAGRIRIVTTTTAQIVVENASGTYITHDVLSATVPFAWGNGDGFTLIGTYEAATGAGA